MTAMGTTASGSRIRVLIVEDSSDAAEVFGMLLERRGYAVEVELDSTQCLPHLESFNPDVVFLDIGMPKVCGYDLAKQIRSQPEFDSMAILAISGYGDREHRARSIESGCDRHLVKPVDLAELEAAIAQEIQKRRGQAAQIVPCDR